MGNEYELTFKVVVNVDEVPFSELNGWHFEKRQEILFMIQVSSSQ